MILASYNRESYLEESIQSVLNQQGFSDFELVIVDDGSDNSKTHEILTHFEEIDPRVRVHRQSHHSGEVAVTNFGISQAKGKYIAIHQDDDIMPPMRLLHQFEYMESNPEIGISFGSLKFIDENGEEIGHVNQELLKKKEYEMKFMNAFQNYIGHCSVMAKKQAFNERDKLKSLKVKTMYMRERS